MVQVTLRCNLLLVWFIIVGLCTVTWSELTVWKLFRFFLQDFFLGSTLLELWNQTVCRQLKSFFNCTSINSACNISIYFPPLSLFSLDCVVIWHHLHFACLLFVTKFTNVLFLRNVQIFYWHVLCVFFSFFLRHTTFVYIFLTSSSTWSVLVFVLRSKQLSPNYIMFIVSVFGNQCVASLVSGALGTQA